MKSYAVSRGKGEKQAHYAEIMSESIKLTWDNKAIRSPNEVITMPHSDHMKRFSRADRQEQRQRETFLKKKNLSKSESSARWSAVSAVKDKVK